MLERATACLDTGARLSLRCARRAPRSKRSLHSAFWTHGAGELPPSPLTNSPCPGTPHDLDGIIQQPQASSVQSGAHGGGGVTESPFLDFLYPPPALALLQNSGVESWEIRECRNARRLPKGFVHAKRGYSSKSRRSATSEDSENLAETALKEQEQAIYEHEQQIDPLNEADHSDRTSVPTSETTEAPHEERRPLDNGYDEDLHVGSQKFFADTASDLAESSNTILVQLRRAMNISRDNIALADDKKSLSFTNSVWNLYESLEPKDREDLAVKIELLRWLSINCNDVAETHCLELYSSIPVNERTSSVYKAALSVFLRCNLYGLAEQGHQEALSRLPNGPEFSAWLCKFAIERQMWDMSFRIKQQLDSMHDGFVRSVNDTIFWRQLPGMPGLLDSAISLAKHHRILRRTNSASSEFGSFCVAIFKTAIARDWTPPNLTPKERIRQPLKSGMIRYLLQSIQLIDPYPPDVFRNMLMDILGPESKLHYPEVHHTVSYMFYQYVRMPGVKLDKMLLFHVIKRFTEYYGPLEVLRKTRRSVSIRDVLSLWKQQHGKVDEDAYNHLLKFYAVRGEAGRVEQMFEELCSDHLDWLARRYGASMLIYVYARRVDADSAQKAFGRAQDIATNSGYVLGIQCWNILIHAFSRAGDLERALKTLDEVAKTPSLSPTDRTFHPVLEIYAARGDVEAVEGLLRQYDELNGGRRTTALYGSLLNAYVARHDVRKARDTLQELVKRNRKKEVPGTLTLCFNILLTAYAARRDVDQTMQAYRWMKEMKIRTDANTFGALILALTMYGSVLHARQILQTVMPQHGHRPTALHYALVFTAYVHQKMWDLAIDFHDLMRRKNVLSSLSSNVSYIRARALMEQQGNIGPSNGATSAADDLRKMLEKDPPTRLALKQPQTIDWKDSGSPAAAYLGKFVVLHGNERALKAAQLIVHEYQEGIRIGKAVAQQAPIGLVQALIDVYTKEREWAKVDECWVLVKEWADSLAPLGSLPDVGVLDAINPADPEIFDLLPPPTDTKEIGVEGVRRKSTKEPNGPADSAQDAAGSVKVPSHRLQIAPGLRYLLSGAVRSYITALSFQARFIDMVNVVGRVLNQGYVLDNRSWNVFIEHLLRPSPPFALLAFRLVERYLIRSFPGWKRYSRFPEARIRKAEGIQWIRTSHTRPDELMPRYRTMVKLGAALLDIRRIEAVGSGWRPPKDFRNSKGVDEKGMSKYVGTTKAIRRFAPKTLHFVQSMPSVPDTLQDMHIRRDR